MHSEANAKLLPTLDSQTASFCFCCRSVFFGDVSPKDKPEFYIQCISNVYQTYADNHKNKVPLIVNTQGWVKGELHHCYAVITGKPCSRSDRLDADGSQMCKLHNNNFIKVSNLDSRAEVPY